MTIIYNVDTEKEVTPLMVRDAMLECFYQAHCLDASLGSGGAVKDKLRRDYCSQIVRKAFVDSGGDFAKPTKASIKGAVEELKEFSKNFRDREIINRHAAEIYQLAKKIK